MASKSSALSPSPVRIYAFQTPANLSDETMRRIIDIKTLGESWQVGTNTATFELSYEHTLIGGCANRLLQFDATRVHISAGSNQGGGDLSQPGQKLVELRLVSEEGVDGLIIQNVTLVERSEGEG